MKKIRFIHSADLHLDSPFQGLRNLPEKLLEKAQESTFTALKNLVRHAINYEVDFVIIAGDLFDGENRSFKAQSQLKKALEQLSLHGISCYIIHGNHDHLNGKWLELSWPDHVFFFKDQVDCVKFQKKAVSVNIYGYSYPEKNVQENIALAYQKQGEADFHIGILHGTAEGQQNHDRYAPFSLAQLLSKDFDYWALGHIHKKQILSENPYVLYPGNTQGRHKNEQGEKGVYLVELTKQQPASVKFLPTAAICWQELTVSIEGIEKIDDLQSRCETSLVEAKHIRSSMFVMLRFIGSGPLHEELVSSVDDLIELVNAEQEEQEIFTYVVDKKLETKGEWSKQELIKEQHLVSDVISITKELSHNLHPLQASLAELFGNHKLRKYAQSMTEEELRELLIEAENYILTELLKEGNK